MLVYQKVAPQSLSRWVFGGHRGFRSGWIPCAHPSHQSWCPVSDRPRTAVAEMSAGLGLWVMGDGINFTCTWNLIFCSLILITFFSHACPVLQTQARPNLSLTWILKVIPTRWHPKWDVGWFITPINYSSNLYPYSWPGELNQLS
jgi:hypothetical protein